MTGIVAYRTNSHTFEALLTCPVMTDFNASPFARRCPLWMVENCVAVNDINIAYSPPSINNGRDQTATFVAGDTVHFYGIKGTLGGGGPQLTTVSSLQPPGVFNPANVAAAAVSYVYLSSLILDGSGNLPDVYQAGNLVTYIAAPLVLNGGAVVNAQPNTSVSLASAVPSVAENVQLFVTGTNPGGGSTHNIGLVSGGALFNVITGSSAATLAATVPNMGAVYYANTASGNTYIQVLGYTVPLL